MKNIAILGSTGSIGQSSLEVIRRYPESFRVAALSTNSRIDTLEKQIREFKPAEVAVTDPLKAEELERQFGDSVSVRKGEEGLCAIVSRDDVDVVISSLVGFAGLRPTVHAIKRRKKIALANKETLVAAGHIITKLIEEYGVELVPIDSEHSAILQCLVGEPKEAIRRLILTASGGPFLSTPKDDLKRVTVEQALKHPNWKMGSKITIDSATLMNKGLEVIEAHWLFGLPPSAIDVVIHPQSVIHSMVEFVDGSVKAQLGLPDMKIPIAYALSAPGRLPAPVPPVSFASIGSLTFYEPDTNRFPALAIAYDAVREGGTAPATMNAANEVAVQAFLNGKLSFTLIADLIRRTLDHNGVRQNPELEHIFEADRNARTFAFEVLS